MPILTKPQLRLLKELRKAFPRFALFEELVPYQKYNFRSLGPFIEVKRIYRMQLAGKAIPYSVFRALFKSNLIEPFEQRSLVTMFRISTAGFALLRRNNRRKKRVAKR